MDSAWEDIDRVREKLLSEDHAHEGHVGTQRQTLLAVSYLQAVGQAPLLQAERARLAGATGSAEAAGSITAGTNEDPDAGAIGSLRPWSVNC